MTTVELARKIEKLEGLLEKAAKPASQAAPNQIFGGGFDSNWTRDPWPAERLKALSKAYNSDAAVQMLAKDHRGKPRGIGWGPALAKMAGIANPALTTERDYGPENFEKEFGFTTVAKANQRGVKGLNGEIRKTALAEGSGLTGGYIVPPQFLNELMTIAGEDAFIEPRAKVIPMTSRTMQIPMLDITSAPSTGTSPYFGGILATWQPEASSISETEPQFKQTEWTAWDLVLYSVSSNQLLADNGVGLDALLTQLFSQAMTWYKEYAFLRGIGAGSSMPLGVLNAPAALGVQRLVSGRFLMADAAAMMAKLHVRSWDNACWIMHQSVLPELLLMVDGGSAASTFGTGASTAYPGGGRLAFLNAADPSGGPATQKIPQAFLNGLPIFFTEKLPKLGTASANSGAVMLVDWSKYVIGNRLDVQIDVSPHYLFRNNQLAWRVVCRADGRPWLNSYITDSQGFTSSPFVYWQAA